MKGEGKGKFTSKGGWNEQKIDEVGKAATSATSLNLNNLTRYISATWVATSRYVNVSEDDGWIKDREP